jgi:hypothetical protein
MNIDLSTFRQRYRARKGGSTLASSESAGFQLGTRHWRNITKLRPSPKEITLMSERR